MLVLVDVAVLLLGHPAVLLPRYTRWWLHSSDTSRRSSRGTRAGDILVQLLLPGVPGLLAVLPRGAPPAALALDEDFPPQGLTQKHLLVRLCLLRIVHTVEIS